jgi:hypothetical protein
VRRCGADNTRRRIGAGSAGAVADRRQAFRRIRDSDVSPWARDLQRIRPLLHVVDNNSATSIGGGGTPRQPLAPPFQ